MSKPKKKWEKQMLHSQVFIFILWSKISHCQKNLMIILPNSTIKHINIMFDSNNKQQKIQKKKNTKRVLLIILSPKA